MKGRERGRERGKEGGRETRREGERGKWREVREGEGKGGRKEGTGKENPFHVHANTYTQCSHVYTYMYEVFKQNTIK